jgi:hypothetical protein
MEGVPGVIRNCAWKSFLDSLRVGKILSASCHYALHHEVRYQTQYNCERNKFTQ